MEISTEPAVTRTRKARVAKPAEPKATKTAANHTPDKPASTVSRRKAAKKVELVQDIDLQPMIATAAYYLAEQRNFAPGYELQDWLTAEQQVRSAQAA